MIVGVVGVGEFLSPVLMCLLLMSVFFLSPFIIPRWLLFCRSIFLAGWLKKKSKKIYAVGFKVHRTVALYMCVIFHSSLSASAASLFPSRIRGGGGGCNICTARYRHSFLGRRYFVAMWARLGE